MDSRMHTSHIERLRGIENWTIWKFQIVNILISQDAFSVLDGTHRPPAQTDTQHDLKLEKYNKAENVCRQLLATTVERKPLELIATSKTPLEMWNKLLSVYEQNSADNIAMLLKQFMDCSCSNDGDLMDYINTTERFYRQLETLKAKFNEDVLIAKTLSGLPSRYDSFCDAWDSTSKDDRTYAKLVERLAKFNCREQDRNKEDTTALLSTKHFKQQNKNSKKQNYKTKGTSATTSKRKYCGICKIADDHWRSECTNNKAQNFQTAKATGEKVLITVPNALVAEQGTQKWIFDSGATTHMVGEKHLFETFEPYSSTVTGVGSKTLQVTGKGRIRVKSKVGKTHIELILTDVEYVPGLQYRLFSLSRAEDHGAVLIKTADGYKLQKDGETWAFAYRQNSLYIMDFHDTTSEQVFITNIGTDINTWHNRLGHQNYTRVKEVLNQHQINIIDKPTVCTGCLRGKQTRNPFVKTRTKATKSGEVIHVDLVGKITPTTFSGYQYFALFRDDYSHYRFIHFLRSKADVPSAVIRVCKLVKNHCGSMGTLHSDCGTEFVNQTVDNFLEEEGILHEKAPPYTPQHNGVAERENRTVTEMVRSMLHSKELDKRLWAEAAATAVYILNRTGISEVPNKSPHEVWTGTFPSIEHLQVFGSKCSVHIPAQKRHKLDAKSEDGVFVGYSDTGYRILNPRTQKLTVSRDVKFTEEQYSTEVATTTTAEKHPILLELNFSIESDILHADEYHQESEDSEARQDTLPHEARQDTLPHEARHDTRQHEARQDTCQHSYSLRRRDDIHPPEKLTLMVSETALLATCTLPQNATQALHRSDGHLWKQAMLEELKSLESNNTWELIDPPSNAKIIQNRWVFRIKYKSDGSVDRYKARLVAKGYSQRPGIDYEETFAPVARLETFRALLSIAATKRLQLVQFDITTAFLYGLVDKEIYMYQPEGFSDGTQQVCKLFRCIYGLKQAPRVWNQRFTKVLSSFGLQPSDADPCLFIKHAHPRLYLLIYVDDGYGATENTQQAEKLFYTLRQEFHITISNAEHFLGLEIEQLDTGIKLHQCTQIENLAKRFQLTNSNPKWTPLEPGILNSPHDTPAQDVSYRELVGALTYISIASRPDIAFPVNVLSRCLEHPSTEHWSNAKRTVQYLLATKNLGILYKYNDKTTELYSDADFAMDKDTRHSTSGIVLLVAGGAVYWKSKKQSSISTSSTEAEVMAACQATKELVWQRRLYNSMHWTNFNPTLRIDNTSAISIIENSGITQRNKHFDVSVKFTQEKLATGQLTIQHVASSDQKADILTKPLSRAKLEYNRASLGLI